MNLARSFRRLLLLAGYGLLAATPARGAGITLADSSIASAFDINIDFDVNPMNPPSYFDDDVAILAQYLVHGVQFRDVLGSFQAPLGGSPGEIDDDEWKSFPNSLEIGDDDDDDEAVYVLFQTPVLAAGAYVLGDDDDDDDVFLTAYDVDLQVVGTVSIESDEDQFRFLGFTADQQIAVIRFTTGDDDLHIDDLGAASVPEPGSLLLLGLGAVPLLRSRRRALSHDRA